MNVRTIQTGRFAMSAVVLVLALAIAITALALEAGWQSWTGSQSTGQSISHTHVIASRNKGQRSNAHDATRRPSQRMIEAMKAP
jgi:hypothetical protein